MPVNKDELVGNAHLLSSTPTGMVCELCERMMEQLTVHHLTPRQKTKRKKVAPGPTIQICSACHRQIHALFNNSQLAKELNSIDKLKSYLDMANFLTWVKRQDPDRRIKASRRKG
jgi:3-methyladenine DNA glycosylase AlkC